jgi:hypothetical protein
LVVADAPLNFGIETSIAVATKFLSVENFECLIQLGRGLGLLHPVTVIHGSIDPANQVRREYLRVAAGGAAVVLHIEVSRC